VHVGKHAGVQLGDLDAEAVEKLLTLWLPTFATMAKPKAADKRLAAALERAKACARKCRFRGGLITNGRARI
jgi:hypothetical protein